MVQNWLKEIANSSPMTTKYLKCRAGVNFEVYFGSNIAVGKITT